MSQRHRQQAVPCVFVLANKSDVDHNRDDNGRVLRREISRLRFLLATDWSPRLVLFAWINAVIARRCFLRMKRAASVVSRCYRGYKARSRWAILNVASTKRLPLTREPRTSHLSRLIKPQRKNCDAFRKIDEYGATTQKYFSLHNIFFQVLKMLGSSEEKEKYEGYLKIKTLKISTNIDA